MLLSEFIQRVSAKVKVTEIPPVMERHLTIQDDKKTVLGALYVCSQCLNRWDGKYDEIFHNAWIQSVRLIKKHSPDFFDEFSGEHEVREQLKAITNKPEGYGRKSTFQPRAGDYEPGKHNTADLTARGRRKR